MMSAVILIRTSLYIVHHVCTFYPECFDAMISARPRLDAMFSVHVRHNRSGDSVDYSWLTAKSVLGKKTNRSVRIRTR